MLRIAECPRLSVSCRMGELSADRVALEAAELAPGTNATYSCKTQQDDHPARGNPFLNIS